MLDETNTCQSVPCEEFLRNFPIPSKKVFNPLDRIFGMLYYKPRPRGQTKCAEVVKLVDTQRSGRCARKGMGVRVPPSASRFFYRNPLFLSTNLQSHSSYFLSM